MQHISPEQFEEARKRVPGAVFDFILSDASKEIIRGFVSRYKLHLDKIDILTRAILHHIMGLISGLALREVIERDLGLTQTDATTLYEEVLKKILLPVQNIHRDIAERDRESYAKTEAEEMGDVGEDTWSEPAITQPSEAHALTNTPLGVIEDEDLRGHAAQRPMRTAPVRTEIESVAHVVDEKNNITERKLSEMTTTLPRASTNVNVAAEAPVRAPAMEPERTDRTSYHGQDPYREPVGE